MSGGDWALACLWLAGIMAVVAAVLLTVARTSGPGNS
jgi:hypothetical protein